jgi:hypothetical protein
MELHEKLEADYEKVKQNYLQQDPEILVVRSEEFAQRLRIYRYYARHLECLEQIPGLTILLTEMDNLLEETYQYLEECQMLDGRKFECGMVCWLNSQMDLLRNMYQLQLSGTFPDIP